MANTARNQLTPVKRANDAITQHQYDTHRQVVADQAKGDALGTLPHLLLWGGGVGAAGALWDSWQQRKKLEKLKQQVQFNPRPFPVYGKSASAVGDAANFSAGDYAQSKWSTPWFLPSAALAMYGGYQAGKGGVNSMLLGNTEADATREAERQKRKYLQALRGTLPMADGGYQKMAYAPSFFSLDTFGPAMGVGVGAVGTLSLANLLSRFHMEKEKNRKLRESGLRAGLEEDIRKLQPKFEAKAPVAAPFNY